MSDELAGEGFLQDGLAEGVGFSELDVNLSIEMVKLGKNGSEPFQNLGLLGERRKWKCEAANMWLVARRKLFEVARNSTALIAEDGLKRIADL